MVLLCVDGRLRILSAKIAIHKCPARPLSVLIMATCDGS